MRWVIHPRDPRCRQEAIVGGKAASLARLCGDEVDVPPFVVISANAFVAMHEGGPSPELCRELEVALAELDLSAGVAVRSSAVGEDSADNSFAGLYHTSLEVDSFDAVLAAVRECWASYSGAAAVEYREGRDPGQPGAMAVVVQQMVVGQWSGVCFTADPVSLALSRGVINAVEGLGEALVSGAVNPQQIIVSAADGRILQRSLGDSDRPLPADVAGQVWSVSKQIADRWAFPQDTEWAWRDGRLFILQSRPITTIADVYYSRALEPWRNDPAADPDNPERIWSRMLADETWVSPISPLFYNVHNSTPGRVAFIRSHGDRRELPPDIFKYHRATAYADVDLIRRMYEFQPKLARIRGVCNFLPADMEDEFKRAPFRWLGRLRRSLSYEFQDRRIKSFFRNYEYVQKQWPAYVAKSNRWFDMDLQLLSVDELRAHQAEVQKEMAAVGPPCATAVLSHATDLHLLLTGLLDRWCRHLGLNGENLYAKVSSGLDDSDMLRVSEELWSLAQRIRQLGPQMSDLAVRSDWSDFKRALAAQADGPALINSFEAFWRDHRHLGSSYKDLIWPRWGDDIDLLFGVVKGYAQSAAERPTEVHARSARSRREAQAWILESFSGPSAVLKRATLRFLFRYNERYMAIRDNHRFFVDRNWYELRRIYRAYGRHLVERRVLYDADDVFFLGQQEIEAGLQGDLLADEASRRVQVRRRVWQETLRQQGPKFLKGWAPYQDQPAAAVVSGTLQGIAASPGSATGTARVVHDVSGLVTVKDGEILVTRQTDPSWTTVFGRIGGLILETGGVLSHGTSLCREYGLPCVTSVERATVRIRDGARIELVGSEGIVRLLDPS